MNEYISLFIMIAFTAIGFLLGFSVMVHAFRTIPRHKSKKRQRVYHSENEEIVQLIKEGEETDFDDVSLSLDDEDFEEDFEDGEDDIVQDEPQVGLLKKRLGGRKDSWIEFNCSCDGVDEKEYIKSSQKKEDNSYRYTKKKGQP